MAMKQLGAKRIDRGVISYLEQVVDAGQWCRFYDKDGTPRRGMVCALEEWAQSFFHRSFALATTSGTQSLTNALKALDVRGKEVILPAYAFAACPTAILSAGAIPVIAPIDETLSMDVSVLNDLINPRTAAIMTVHMRGLPHNMKSIHEIAAAHSIPILDDCSQADGLTIQQQPAGSLYCDIAVYSFQAKKIMTAGEGGLIITDQEQLYERCFCLHDPAWYMRASMHFAERQEYYASAGCRMNEITAAVLLYQAQNFADFQAQLRERRHRLIERLLTVASIAPIPKETEPGGTVALVAPEPQIAGIWRQKLQAYDLHLYQESANPRDPHFYLGWPAMLREQCVMPCDLAHSTRLLAQTILLQIDPDWSDVDIKDIARCVIDVINDHND